MGFYILERGWGGAGRGGGGALGPIIRGFVVKF